MRKYVRSLLTQAVCPACGETLFIDESNIKTGEKYEVECPGCAVLLLRKKGGDECSVATDQEAEEGKS